MKKLTYAELAELQERKQWGELWEYALPWVKYTIKQMIERGTLDPFYAREDLLQEGNLVAGRFVQTWNPLEGSLGTWVCVNVRGELLKYLGEQSNRGMGSRNVRSKTYQLQDKHSRRFTVPDGEDAIEEAQTAVLVRYAIELLSGLTRQVAIECYQNGLSVEECAARLGIAERTVKRRRKIALKKLAPVLKKKVHPL